MTDPTDDEPICPLSADGLCCPERDGRCHWCDRDCTQAPSTADRLTIPGYVSDADPPLGCETMESTHRRAPGAVPFPDFPRVMFGRGALAGCLVLRLEDGRERLLCDVEHAGGPGGCGLHAAIRLLCAGAARDTVATASTDLDAAKFAADVWEIADSTGVAQRDDEDTIAWLRRAVRELARQRDEARVLTLQAADSGTAADGTRYLLAGGRAYTQAHGDAPEAIDPLAYRGVVRPDTAQGSRMQGSEVTHARVRERRFPVTVYQSTDGMTWAPNTGHVEGLWTSEDIARERERLARNERVAAFVRPQEAGQVPGRARYPLLVHPDDVGSRAPLDPIEARACRQLRPGELVEGLPWDITGARRIARAGAYHSTSMFDVVCGELAGLALRQQGVFVVGGLDVVRASVDEICHSTAHDELREVNSTDGLAAWADRWLVVNAWVCEGDEP